MALKNLRVRKLSLSDVNKAVEILSRAFHEDPLWLYLTSNEQKRKKWQKKFFKTLILLQFGSVEILGVSMPLEGVALWEFPDTPIVSLKEIFNRMIKSGIISLTFSSFIFKIFKVTKVFSKIQELHNKYAPESHYYLSSIAVQPESQGKGLASVLINFILDKADSKYISAYTETVTPRNVSFYQHFGFKIMEKYDFPKKNLSVWSLYRPAKKR